MINVNLHDTIIVRFTLPTVETFGLQSCEAAACTPLLPVKQEAETAKGYTVPQPLQAQTQPKYQP